MVVMSLRNNRRQNVRRKTSAFTLIELLVVISIVALLIALLLPALSQARETAQIVLCLSNQRSLTLVTNGYVTDNDGFFPPAMNLQGKGWAGHLTPDYLSDQATLECPVQNISGFLVSYIATGPAWMFSPWGQPNSPYYFLTTTTMNDVRSPSRMVMFTEQAEIRDIYVGGWVNSLTADAQPGLCHRTNFAAFLGEEFVNAGRHQMVQGSPYEAGLATFSMVDGSARTEDMGPVVDLTTAFGTGQYAYGYPPSPANMGPWGVPPPAKPNPGVTFWFVPWW